MQAGVVSWELKQGECDKLKEQRKRSKKNKRPLSWAVHSPYQLKLLQHIDFDGLAERKPLI